MKAKDLVDTVYEMLCEFWNNDKKIEIDHILLPELESQEIEKLIKVTQKLQDDMISQYGDTYKIIFSLYCKILLGEKNTKKIDYELDLGKIPISEALSIFNPEKVKCKVVVVAIIFMTKSFLDVKLKNIPKEE